MLSSAARAMWPISRTALMPMIMPLAYGSQCGAPRPVKAGTKTTLSESRTEAAISSTSGDAAKNRMLSRSHCTTAPPMKTLPSSAYSSLLIQPASQRRDQALAATA